MTREKMRTLKSVTLGAVFIVLSFVPGFAGNTDGIDESPVKRLKVRVFVEGRPVNHLIKEDFKLYEDNIPQTIDDVIISKRKIGEVLQSPSSSRCFVLLFDITDYSSQIQNEVATILHHFLGTNDQLLIAANDQILFFNSLSDKEKAHWKINRFLGEQCSQTKQRMYADLSAIENLINLIRTRSSRETDRHGQGAVHIHYYMKYIKFSIEQYIMALQDYKKKYLVPDVSKYYNLLALLEKVKQEKWVISFYRMPEIPKLSRKNRRMIKKLIDDLQDRDWKDENYYSELFFKMLGQIDNLFNHVDNFPVEAMSQLFYKLDANFHAIVVNADSDKESQDHKHRGLKVDIENNWAEIARRTGGVGVSMETAADTIRSTEDIYYTLTYTPKDPGKPGELNVEVKDKNYKVYFEGTLGAGDFSQYLNTSKDPNTPAVQVNDITFKNKRFSITITGFLVQKMGKENSGRISVLIYIKDNQESKILFHQGKTLLPQKDTVHISLSFQWLKKGSYEIGVRINDLLTGKSTVKAISAVVD
jgi:hypothetical protein